MWNAYAPHAAFQEPNKLEKQSNFSYTDTKIKAMIRVIRAFEYDCDYIEHASPHIFSEGFDVFCRGRNGHPYKFVLDNHGGKWSVAAD